MLDLTNDQYESKTIDFNALDEVGHAFASDSDSLGSCMEDQLVPKVPTLFYDSGQKYATASRNTRRRKDSVKRPKSDRISCPTISMNPSVRLSMLPPMPDEDFPDLDEFPDKMLEKIGEPEGKPEKSEKSEKPENAGGKHPETIERQVTKDSFDDILETLDQINMDLENKIN